MFIRFLGALVLLGLASVPSLAQPIVLGQVDTFQDLTTQNWRNGPSFPDPENVGGGQGGAGDRYLRVTSGSFPLPPRIATINTNQWTGNYLSAGVTRVEMDLLNLTGSTLHMRFGLREVSGPAAFTPAYVNNVAIQLPADGAWHHVIFELDAAHLIGINNPAPLNTFLTNVGEARIFHSQPLSIVGELGTFQFGVDNILAAGAAVPEMTTWMLLTLAAACAGVYWTRRTSLPAAPCTETPPNPPSEPVSCISAP